VIKRPRHVARLYTELTALIIDNNHHEQIQMTAIAMGTPKPSAPKIANTNSKTRPTRDCALGNDMTLSLGAPRAFARPRMNGQYAFGQSPRATHFSKFGRSADVSFKNGDEIISTLLPRNLSSSRQKGGDASSSTSYLNATTALAALSFYRQARCNLLD
jgi:hypothetical protein